MGNKIFKIKLDENGIPFSGYLEEYEKDNVFKSNIKRCLWYKNGVLHRDDGPACIVINKLSNQEEYTTEFWYKDGILHRDDGPAVDEKSVMMKWYNNGNITKIEYYNDGGVEYYKNGVLHREDGPALIKENGDKEWYFNGVLHRDDGPAIELHNGERSWFTNGKREDTYGNDYIVCPSIKKKVDINIIYKKFEEDILNLISMYSSFSDGYIFAEYLTDILELSKKFIYKRDEFLYYDNGDNVLIDHPQLTSNDCNVENEKEN